MGKLIYATPLSLDGYIGDNEYDWSNPGEDGHAFITKIIEPIGTYLYGRKTYDTMSVWEEWEGDFAKVWKAADKIIFSKTLDKVSTPNSRLVHEFDPQMIRDLKAKSTKDITVGGPNLGAQALRAGLVDEIHLFIVPKIKGGGLPVWPKDLNLDLKLMEEQKFAAGWIYLRYQVLN